MHDVNDAAFERLAAKVRRLLQAFEALQAEKKK